MLLVTETDSSAISISLGGMRPPTLCGLRLGRLFAGRRVLGRLPEHEVIPSLGASSARTMVPSPSASRPHYLIGRSNGVGASNHLEEATSQ
jgi:hypothetical protein